MQTSATLRNLFSFVLSSSLLCGAALSSLGCEGQRFGAREAGALTGAALGAGLGAIVGNQAGNTGAGIAIGSGFGALAGGLVGNEVDNQNAALDDRESRLNDQERELAENRRLIDELRARGADVRPSDRGVVVNLPDVLFDFNSARLTREAARTARDIADVASTASGRTIAVEGHTDSIGTIEYNKRLSLNRARSVADALSREGVSRGRMVVRGLGESEPITTNATDSGRARNRRVEVIIENR
jgi:outer membrane protein OmpA-like peptidoglycan-associated protein